MKGIENVVELITIVACSKHITYSVHSPKLNVLKCFKDDISSKQKNMLKLNVQIVSPWLRKRKNLQNLKIFN